MAEIISHNSPEQDANEKEFLRRYNEVRENLEDLLGFKLSNIELVGLKRIIEEVINQVDQERREHTSFMDRISDYYAEIYSRWFPQFLDIRYDELPRDKEGNLDGATKEYLRRKHEEQHLI